VKLDPEIDRVDRLSRSLIFKSNQLIKCYEVVLSRCLIVTENTETMFPIALTCFTVKSSAADSTHWFGSFTAATSTQVAVILRANWRHDCSVLTYCPRAFERGY